MQIEIELSDESGEPEKVRFPAKYCVCRDCRGEGRTLRAGIREHCYSSEEFDQEFPDDESRDAYFDSSSHLHEPCPTCKGQRVELRIDRQACRRDPELRAALARYDDSERDEAEYRALVESERRFGC